MKREWRHEVSETWLRTRKLYLTASDIKNLVKEYDRISSGKVKLSQSKIFAKLYGEKQSNEIDTESYGAMARGHILEPYAIEDYKRLASTYGMKQDIYWWDDKIICRNGVGFSPDGLDIQQLPGTRITCIGDELLHRDGRVNGPKRIIEVKCYEGGKHFQKKIADKDDLEERWQIACAMWVCPTIRSGTLLFYAPQCGDMFWDFWWRSELKDEIDIVNDIQDMWIQFCKSMERSASINTTYTEDDIYNRYLLDEMGR